MGLSSTVVAAAYRAQQLSLLLPALALQRSMRLVTSRGYKPAASEMRAVQRRYQQLLDVDLANAREGLYPRALLFQFPMQSYLRAMPSLLRDVPRTLRRLRSENFQDLPANAQVERYPAYYQRNFHWQTDGYLSRRSARIYDVGVEWLFLGTADIMRRQVIPPITRFLRERSPAADRVRLLDVACGTGRTLKQLWVAHPDMSLFGVDLSPYYVQDARALLADHPNISLLVENAESLPLRDETFDVVTSVFLFHELPRDARRRVMHEMLRTVRPGGLVVIADSAQSTDSPDLAPFLSRFTVDFHEPYYKGYQRDPIEDALAEVGFDVASVDTHFVTKVVTARRPI